MHVFIWEIFLFLNSTYSANIFTQSKQFFKFKRHMILTCGHQMLIWPLKMITCCGWHLLVPSKSLAALFTNTTELQPVRISRAVKHITLSNPVGRKTDNTDTTQTHRRRTIHFHKAHSTDNSAENTLSIMSICETNSFSKSSIYQLIGIKPTTFRLRVRTDLLKTLVYYFLFQLISIYTQE
jgi:hypothetical protein